MRQIDRNAGSKTFRDMTNSEKENVCFFFLDNGCPVEFIHNQLGSMICVPVPKSGRFAFLRKVIGLSLIGRKRVDLTMEKAKNDHYHFDGLRTFGSLPIEIDLLNAFNDACVYTQNLIQKSGYFTYIVKNPSRLIKFCAYARDHHLFRRLKKGRIAQINKFISRWRDLGYIYGLTNEFSYRQADFVDAIYLTFGVRKKGATHG